MTMPRGPQSAHRGDGGFTDAALSADDRDHLFHMGTRIWIDLEVGLRRRHLSGI